MEKGINRNSTTNRVVYPCHAIISTLILNSFWYYDKIMNMSFESGIYTYITAAS